MIKKVRKVLIGVFIFLVAAGFLFYGFFKYKNQQPMPDYYEIYKTQDSRPAGKVGIFISGLVMPENYNHWFFHNIVIKIFKTVIPWPFNQLAMRDRGVALLDPTHFYSRKKFVPKKLVDSYGNNRDNDGTPYMKKYWNGEVVWVPPSKQVYLDHGYFLFKGHPGGEPSICGKVATKARVYYYDSGIVQKKIPHWEQSLRIINTAVDKLKEKYGDIEWRFESNMFYHDMRKKLREMLDNGCDTIILSSPMPIYSHFEDFNSTFRHSFEYIEEWEKSSNKKIKVIIAPQMGDFAILRQAFIEMLKDRLDTLPEASSVTVAVTCHGMPWDAFPWEAWLKLAPDYRDGIFKESKELLATYKFSKTNVVISQDHFADPIWDPKQKYLSTNRAYWNAINDGYDYAIGLPIEFFAENTDTLMHHAMVNFENFDQYRIEDSIDYPDWSVPYTRELVQGKTHVIYNGVPVGKYQHYVIDALYQSLDSVMSKKM